MTSRASSLSDIIITTHTITTRSTTSSRRARGAGSWRSHAGCALIRTSWAYCDPWVIISCDAVTTRSRSSRRRGASITVGRIWATSCTRITTGCTVRLIYLHKSVCAVAIGVVPIVVKMIASALSAIPGMIANIAVVAARMTRLPIPPRRILRLTEYD